LAIPDSRLSFVLPLLELILGDFASIDREVAQAGLPSMISKMARKGKARPKILFVDDDLYYIHSLVEGLQYEGYEVSVALDADKALALAGVHDFDLVILDVMMPPGTLGEFETQSGYKTGIVLSLKLREMRPHLPILALTSLVSEEVVDWFSARDSMAYVRKPTGVKNLLRSVNKLLGRRRTPSVFIVHGRDSQALTELKTFLSQQLAIPSPTVLAEQPSKGKTVIEKFEHYAQDVDFVFVLATADDLGRFAGPHGQDKPRSRQNVVFELGFFLGALRRSSGRVLLLYEPGVELPSDLSGIVYIDISNGISSAAPEIRRELAEWIE
jgi:CheY-like chemotaxis protein